MDKPNQGRGICFWPSQQLSTTFQTAVSSGWTRKGPLDRDRGGGEKWRILVVLDTRGLTVPKCFLWYGIMWEAKGFVSTCVLCNRNKCPKHHVRAEMTPCRNTNREGAERVHLDHLGPLPQLGSKISMFWSPSKWIASPYPLRWQMSLQVPQQIFTDQGCNFKNENCF